MNLSIRAQSIQPSPTLEVDAKAKKMKAEGIDVIGFGAGEPDFGTPKHIALAGKEAIEQGFTRYTPASGINELKEAVCEKFKVDNGIEYGLENIVVSNGAKHSLSNAFFATLDKGDEVLISAPFWVSYPELIKMAGGTPVFIQTSEFEGFKLTPEKIKDKLTKNTKAIIINSPSNPTGMVYSYDELVNISKLVIEHDLYVISDEIYEELIYDDKTHISIASLSEEMKNRTIVINGLSKSFAMTGWRIGYSACETKIAKAMANIQSHATSNPNSIAQKAAVTALKGDKGFMNEMRVEFVKRRDYMVQRINNIEGISCIKPEGAFYIMMNISKVFGKTCNGEKISNDLDFSRLLLENAHVAVVAGSAFGSNCYVRLSYATSYEAIMEGLDRIEKFLDYLR